ncbi:lipoprotein [Actinotalea ferrariae CF5-4]|uniref:Lipoprotein n=1 Tax=Actinotalea ferrariae CF5-4 TaxID=948458 RepID=A0A021VUD7_9CELL|nr:DUF4129 domain-containing protein [Actinotalea ferrariae]EYR62687.1 lipoprotein [Actinotalea ferrariae CF5-4]
MTAPVLPLDVPVEPDAATARRWAEVELSDPAYQDRPNLLETVLRWLGDRFADLQVTAADVDPRAAATLITVLGLVAAVVALVVAGPVRRARRDRRPSVDVFGDDTRTAAELRASADALAAAGDWSGAVLDRFRAVLRSLEERVVLDERPGRTAHEAAEEAGARLPGCAVDLTAAAVLFDDVCYGDAQADAADDVRLRDLDRRVAAERPALVPEQVA